MHYLFKSIRARITLWHLLVLTVTLLVYILLSLAFLWRQLTVELKTSLRNDIEVVENVLQRDPDGNIVWGGHSDGQEKGEWRLWVEVRDQSGGVVYRNFPREEALSVLQPTSSELHVKSFHPVQLAAGENLLVAQELHQVAGERINILVGRSKSRLHREIIHLMMVQALGFPVIILFAWFGGYLFAGQVLSPLKKIIARVKTITADRLHERLPVENADDELGQLSVTFNDLLGKLDRSFSQMRQFTADASHELRTPLSAIRSVGEMALRNSGDEAKCRETIASMLEEVDRMSALVNDLLALARSDCGIDNATFTIQDLGAIVREEVALLRILAEEKSQTLILEIESPCPVQLNRPIIRQVVINILHNAIKFTPENETIRIKVGKHGNECYVDIVDAGPGIGPEHLERVFDRFYRIDKARSREVGGFGLGLAIAKWAVEAHDGCIELDSKPGDGSTFRIRLPVKHLS